MQQPNPIETPRIRFPFNRIQQNIVRGTLFVILAAGLLYLGTLLFPNWRCMIADVQIAIAAPYQDCWKECTSWQGADCSGWSSCYNKWISCSGGRDQDGRPCQGCCFSCKVVCDDPTPTPVPLQPPTISGTLTCTQWGQNGWCVGDETLDLTASDPQGKNVLISGDINGVPFACPSQTSPANCPVSLPEGSGAANFMAASETGLTDSGSQVWQRDSIPPTAAGSLTGVSGDNGWFISSVELSASATETGSGLNAFETSLDGVNWTPYAAPLVFGDGAYTVRLRASDMAGNVSETVQAVNVDTIAPALDLSVDGASGANGWYVSAVEISASASDSGSGLAALEYVLDSGAWTAYTSPLTFGDGGRGYRFRAVDAAGNSAETTGTLNVDTIPPSVDGALSGTPGSAGWYVSAVEASAAAADETSGIASIEYAADGGAWTAYPGPLGFHDGSHTLQFRTTDAAGLSASSGVFSFKVDAGGPHISIPDWWYIWESADFRVSDDNSGIASVSMTISDPQGRWQKVRQHWTPGGTNFTRTIRWDRRFADGTLAPIGTYRVAIYAQDEAGNESQKTARIIIPAPDATAIPRDDDALVLGNPPAPTPTFTPTAIAVPPASAPVQAEPEVNAQPTTDQKNNTTIPFGGKTESPPPAVPGPADNILWGARAAAAVGAFAALIAERKRREEAARQRAARYKRIAQAYYRSRLAARGAAKEEGKPARRFDPMRNRAYRQAAMAYQTAMRAQKPHSQPDSDDIAARFERDDRTTAALLDELRGRRIRAGLDEMEAEKRLDYQDLTPQPSQTSDGPMCTAPPPQVFIGPAPTPIPTPTPPPSLSSKDVAHGICEAADVVDPWLPDPATVGGPDVGDIIDQAYVWQQSVPVISPESEAIFRIFVRLPIQTAKFFKGGFSTAVNFVCQQKDKEGPYYELFPIDQKVQSVKSSWGKWTQSIKRL